MVYSVVNPDSVVVMTVTPVVTGVSVHLFSEHEVIVTTVVDWSSPVTIEVDNDPVSEEVGTEVSEAEDSVDEDSADELTVASWVIVALTSKVMASRLASLAPPWATTISPPKTYGDPATA